MEGTREKQDQAEEGVQQQCGLAALTLEIKWRVGVLPCAAKWVGVYTLPLLVIEVTHAEDVVLQLRPFLQGLTAGGKKSFPQGDFGDPALCPSQVPGM